ncbi:hypothetical protein N9J42_00850 [bacterium]|nr:hypothetical protein [bacterium]
MPNWKKLITSGSDASLSSLSLSGVLGQNSEKTSLMINGNGLIGTRELGSLAFSSATYNNYTLPLGSSSTRGGFKIGYSESGKNYPIELSSEKMYVNVPWTDTNTQLTDAEIAALGYIKTASDTNTQNTAAEIRTKIGSGNNGHVPTTGTAGHFLKHDGTFGLPSYTINTDTNTQLTDAEIAALGYIKTATDTNTQNTYSTSVVSSSGIKLRLTGAGEDGATTDDVKFVGAGATTVSRTDASTITITSTDTNTDTNTQRSDQEIEDVIEKNVNPVVSATVSNDTTTFTKQDGSTFALTTSDANSNTVTSIRRDNTGTYRTGNINLLGGDNVTIVEKTSGQFVFSSTDTNTDTNTQRSDEEIRDVASAQWTNGTNTTVVKDDANNTIKINSVNTTYSVGDGQLSQKNFTTALKDKLDAIPFVQENDNIDIGTETIMTVYTSPWNAVFFDYVVIKGGNMRAGTVTAVNDATNVEFIETSTADLGDTSDVKLFCDIDTDSMRFRATVKSNDWKVKVLPRMI